MSSHSSDKTSSSQKSQLNASVPGFSKLASDAPFLFETLNSYANHMKNLRTVLHPTLSNIPATIDLTEHAQSDFNVTNGISFLQLRSQLLLQYNMNLLQYMSLRMNGIPVSNHPVVKRLVHLRLLLEKIKPVMTQLQPQISQAISATTVQSQTKTASTVHEQQQHEEEKEEQQQQQSKQQLRPEQTSAFAALAALSGARTLAAASAGDKAKSSSFDDSSIAPQELSKFKGSDDFSTQWLAEENRRTMAHEKAEKIRDKASYSTLVRELREEISDRPQEKSSSGLSMHKFTTKEMRERRDFEEENLVRVIDRAPEKKKLRQMQRLQGMDDFEDIADYDELVRLDRKHKDTLAKERQAQEDSVQQERDLNFQRKLDSMGTFGPGEEDFEIDDADFDEPSSSRGGGGAARRGGNRDNKRGGSRDSSRGANRRDSRGASRGGSRGGARGGARGGQKRSRPF